VLLILVYILFIVAYGIYGLLTRRVAGNAIIYGWLVDIRPVCFFALTLLTFANSSAGKVSNFRWQKLILIPALIVVVFGFLQFTVLPQSTLSHIGYSKATILPFETVDQSNLTRVQSTLRGPNPLGVYLLLIIVTLVVLTLSRKGQRWRWALFILICLTVLFGTYSRSAEIGLLLSMFVLFGVYEKDFIRRHYKGMLVGLALLAIVSTTFALRDTHMAQNVLFHASDASTSEVSSNAQRASALKNGALDVVHHPLGGGVGSAGPASFRNTDGVPKIAENYYLQLGQEVGVLGMALFIAINILVGVELWKLRTQTLSRILLASLVGITFINLVSHAWTDDTISYVWWGLAGIALSPVILKSRHKQDEQVHS
jgi:type IV secretory pathway VirB2 component (pilin)